MTEPIEKWREEFIKHSREEFDLLGEEFFALDKHGQFSNDSTYLRFEGFCDAKRSQPVVELPIPEKDCFSPCYECGDIHEALTDAGIQYRIKGD